MITGYTDFHGTYRNSQMTASAETWYEYYREQHERANKLQAELDSIKEMTLLELIEYIKFKGDK